ncbi:MAG TPA: hypothetical protein VJ855_03155 [Marinilabiliaceae bacterium]|nr:hypothetical protein [Marinilabiliaceae bacterium]
MKSNNRYEHIDSFKKLADAKMQLTYETRLSRRKMDMAIYEVRAALSPVRILSGLLTSSVKPLSKGLFNWLGGLLTRKR